MFPAPNIFPPFIFLCVGQSVSLWVPLELTSPPPAPPPVGVGQVLWVPAKRGASPSHSAPPPLTPVAKKNLAQVPACPAWPLSLQLFCAPPRRLPTRG